MLGAERDPATAQSRRFLYLYAMAVAGGAVAYIPFLTILLPNHVTQFGREDTLTLLAYTAFVGAISASLANIFFGWISDMTQTRRPWIWAGLLLSSVLLPAMQFASGPALLIALIVCWQFCLNMMLAPLSAWAGDCVPDSQKGLLGGLLAFAPALGALAGVLVTLSEFTKESERLLALAMLVFAMVAPVLILGRPLPMPQLFVDPDGDVQQRGHRPDSDAAVIRMWLARLLVQIAEASLFAFLLLWFRSVSPGFKDNDAASIFAIVLSAAVVATLIVGRWSDRANRPILPLGISAAVAAVGLVMMALADGLPVAIAGYSVFGLSSGIFLALHSSQTLRVLPAPRTRGRDLGLFNLTNTIPSLIMPWLTLAMVPIHGFDALLFALAGLAMLACLMLANVDQAGRRA